MRTTGFISGGGSEQHFEWLGSHFEKARVNTSYATGIPLQDTCRGFFTVVPEVASQYLWCIGEKDRALDILYKYGWENGCYWEEEDALLFLERGFVNKPEKVESIDDKYFRAMDIYVLGNQSYHPRDFASKTTVYNLRDAEGGVYFKDTLALRYASVVYPEFVPCLLERVIDNFEKEGCTYVYMMEDTSTGDVKIGYGKNPEDRLLSLQAGNPRPLKLVAKTWASVKDETALHAVCERFNIHREWFTKDAKDWYYYYFNLKGTTEF